MIALHSVMNVNHIALANRARIIHAFILEHGFRARINDDGSVTLWIPGVNVHTNEVTVGEFVVRTMAEARTELGY